MASLCIKLGNSVFCFCILVFTISKCGECYLGNTQKNLCGNSLPELSQCTCDFLQSSSGEFNDTIVGVSCVDQQFQNSDVLKNLPNTILNLTFVGNNLTELPWNIFGVEGKTGYLKYLDLSRNNITKIAGKTFHAVAAVETLILDNNQWEVDNHTRVFSNFESLRKLSLNSAIKKKPYSISMSHVTYLTWIFKYSYLENLEELHIQFNEIGFLDKEIFCPLKKLKVVHLANNVIVDGEGLVNAQCMKNVESLYLHNNSLSYLRKYEVDQIDEMVHNGGLKNLTLWNNTWHCACINVDFLEWIQSETSGAYVLGSDRYNLPCYREFEGNLLVNVDIGEVKKGCIGNIINRRYKAPYAVMGILFSAIVVFIAAMIFIQRNKIKKRLVHITPPLTMSFRWSSQGPDYQGLV